MLKNLSRQTFAHRIGSCLAVAGVLLLFVSTAAAQPLDSKVLFERAKARRSRNDHLGAILDLTTIIERDPKNADAYVERALAKDSLTLPVFAIGDLDRAIEINPKLAVAYENRERIRYANSIGNWSLIPKDIELSFKLGGTNPLVLRHRATYRAMAGDLDGAIADFDAYLKSDPKDRYYGNSFRGKTRLRFGDAQGAIEDLTRDINNPPPLNDTWLHRGLAYLVAGDKAAADRDFQQYLKLEPRAQATVDEYREIGKILTDNATPQSAADFVKRAELLYAKNWKLNAIADCTRALAFDEAYVPAYVLKAKSLKDLALYEEAMEAFTKAAKLEPTNPEHIYWRGWCAWLSDKYDQAIADCDAVLAIDNRHLNGVNIKAICLYALDRFDEAAQLHVLASEISPNDGVVWANLADDYLRAADYNKCITASNRSLELTPNTTRVLEIRAKAWWGLGELKEAQSDFAKWIELAPRDSAAYLSRARFEVATKQFDAAIADLQKAKELDKYHAEVPRVTALLKSAKGDDAGAAKEIAVALMLNSGHYLNFATRGGLLFKAGKTAEAESDFELATRLYSNFKNQLPAIKEAIPTKGVAAAFLDLPKAKEPRNIAKPDQTTATPPVKTDTPPSTSTTTTSTTPATPKPAALPPAIKKIFDAGVTSYESGDYEKAGSAFKRVITLFPRHGESYLYRGLIYQRAGKTAEAERDFAQAVQIDPGLKSKIEQERGKIK